MTKKCPICGSTKHGGLYTCPTAKLKLSNVTYPSESHGIVSLDKQTYPTEHDTTDDTEYYIVSVDSEDFI